MAGVPFNPLGQAKPWAVTDPTVRGQLFPVEWNQLTGDPRLAMPQVGLDMLAALALPGDVASGQVDPMGPEGLSRAAGFAANVAMPGLAGGAAQAATHGVDPNLLSIFAGPNSKTADLGRLEQAKKYVDELGYGMSPEETWNETGWFQGTDGMWRYEIPDPLYVGDKGVPPDSIAPWNQKAASGQVGQFLNHPELFAAYPELAQLGAEVSTGPFGGTKGLSFIKPAPIEGFYDHDMKFLKAAGPTQTDATSVMLHELQHAIQPIEGFAGGGNPQAMGQLIANLAPQADQQLLMPRPYDVYHSLAGEVEARNVQERFELMHNGRTFPLSTQDTPEHFQFSPQKMINAARSQTEREPLIEALRAFAQMKQMNQ